VGAPDCTPAVQAPRPQRVVASGNPHAVALVPSQVPAHTPNPAQGARPPWGEPLATIVHAPTLPSTSQAWHWPEHAWSQQTPSTHAPLAHCVGAVQAVACASLSLQTPAAQNFPAAQSASSWQSPWQPTELASHAKGGQGTACVVGHSPVPAQDVGSVAIAFAHPPARHDVELPGEAHRSASAPSQVPAHAEPSLRHAGRAPRGAPATGEQMPSLPSTSQA
jgi:hypothetical protein